MKEFPYYHLLPESEYIVEPSFSVDCNSEYGEECGFWTCEHRYLDRTIYVYSDHVSIWYSDDDGGYYEDESEDGEPLETAILRLIQMSIY